MYAIISFTNHYGAEKSIRIEGSSFDLYNSSSYTYRIYIEQTVVEMCAS